MAKSAEAVVDKVRAKAKSTTQYLGRIEALVNSGGLSALDAEQAYRGAFLAFHSHVETTIEYLFMGLMRGRVSHRLSGVRPLVHVRSDQVAIKTVYQGRRYADWLPYKKHTLERANVYFASGRPFTLLDSADRNTLDNLTVLRNALAHDSTHAMRRFRDTFLQGKALPANERRPAGYLRGRHAATQTRFEFLTAQAAQVLERLA